MKADPMKMLGELANFLERPEFTDQTSPAARRALRKAADELHTGLENTWGEVNPPTLVAFFTGACYQAKLAADANPVNSMLAGILPGLGASEQPHTALCVSLAYIARDLLAGERVE